MAKRDKPMIVMRKEGPRLVPETGFDAEQFDALPNRATVRVEPVDARGRGQLAAYWATLARVVEATGRWPTAEHLHEALKWDLGYVRPAYDLAGTPRLAVDSIALDAMKDAERAAFMLAAFARIAEVTGIDLDELRPRRAA